MGNDWLLELVGGGKRCPRGATWRRSAISPHTVALYRRKYSAELGPASGEVGPTRTNHTANGNLSKSLQQGSSIAYSTAAKSRRLQGIYHSDQMELPCVGRSTGM